MFNSKAFLDELNKFRKELQFRKTPLYFAEKFSKYLGFAGIYIKREDLNYTNSIYINYAFPMAFLAKYLNKEYVFTSCGDANYGLAMAYVCNHLGIKLRLYVGYKDYEKQRIIYDQIRTFGSEFLLVTKGNQNLYDATNTAYTDFLLENEKNFFCFHDAVGPHPFPVMAEKSIEVISKEVKEQFDEILSKYPTYIVAPITISLNALSIFNPYLSSSSKLIAVENVNSIVESNKKCKIHGSFSKSLVDSKTGETNYNLEVSGLNYSIINPKLSYLIDENRVQIATVTDEEAIKASLLFAKLEGIWPSLEDGYTLAYIIKLAQKIKGGTILMCLNGSGIKDLNYINANHKDLL